MREEIINDWEKEIEEQFIEILDYGNDLTSEDVWTDIEKIQWLRKSMKSLISSTEKRMAKEIVELLKDKRLEHSESNRDGIELSINYIKSKYE